MARARTYAVLIGLGLLAAACGSAPPRELSGLWSAGPMSCAAGVGIRFNADAIEAYYEDGRQTLFDHPRYQRIGRGDPFRVRIVYDLPRLPGGAHVAGARGVVLLAQQPDGSILPAMHNLLDARTGAARMPLADDPAVEALTLVPCGDGQTTASGLRGRDDDRSGG